MDMVAILVPLGSFAMVVLIIYIIGSRRHNERMELIRQGINPNRAEVKTPGSFTLLAGMVIVALGLAGIVYFIVMGHVDDPDDLFWSIAGFVGGGALLLYYKITAPQRERAMRLLEKQIEATESAIQKPAPPAGSEPGI